MTFTYTVSDTPDDLTRVRFHLMDTVESAAIFSDEEISMAIAEYGGYKAAVIALIDSIIARLAHEPDATADWLRIDWRRSVDSWRTLQASKRQEFGSSSRRGRAVTTYRGDSNQTEAPDWD